MNRIFAKYPFLQDDFHEQDHITMDTISYHEVTTPCDFTSGHGGQSRAEKGPSQTGEYIPS